MNDHVLCCDCDQCLNRGGGIPSAPSSLSRSKPDKPPPWRMRAKARAAAEDAVCVGISALGEADSQ